MKRQRFHKRIDEILDAYHYHKSFNDIDAIKFIVQAYWLHIADKSNNDAEIITDWILPRVIGEKEE